MPIAFAQVLIIEVLRPTEVFQSAEIYDALYADRFIFFCIALTFMQNIMMFYPKKCIQLILLTFVKARRDSIQPVAAGRPFIFVSDSRSPLPWVPVLYCPMKLRQPKHLVLIQRPPAQQGQMPFSPLPKF